MTGIEASHNSPHTEALDRLCSALPPFGDVAEFDSEESKARGTLSWVISAALASGSQPRDVIPTDPTTCPNCGVAMGLERSPYCSDKCREEAAFVRQLRGSLQSGVAFEEERQVALGQKLWRILGGGLPLRQALVPEKTRLQVIKRYEGRCDVCGAPAVTIDHTGSG